MWAGKNLAGAIAWSLALPDGVDRNVAIHAIAYAASRTNPKQALEFILELPGRDQSRAAIEILQPWAASNPSSATTWAASFPEGDLQEIALRTTVGTWAGREPIAAAEWIEKLPTGSNKEQAIGAYAVALAEADPAAAVRWAEMLPDGELRNNRTITLAKRWLDLNETAARTWIEKSPLSAIQKKDLLQPPKP